MPEITKEIWSVLFQWIIGGFAAGIGAVVSFAVWKANKVNTDKNQDTALKNAGDAIKSLQAENKGFGESLSKIQNLIELQGKDIEALKQESDDNIKVFDEIKAALKELSPIPAKLDGLKELLESKISNVKEAVQEVKAKAPAPKRTYAKRTSSKVVK